MAPKDSKDKIYLCENKRVNRLNENAMESFARQLICDEKNKVKNLTVTDNGHGKQIAIVEIEINANNESSQLHENVKEPMDNTTNISSSEEANRQKMNKENEFVSPESQYNSERNSLRPSTSGCLSVPCSGERENTLDRENIIGDTDICKRYQKNLRLKNVMMRPISTTQSDVSKEDSSKNKVTRSITLERFVQLAAPTLEEIGTTISPCSLNMENTNNNKIYSMDENSNHKKNPDIPITAKATKNGSIQSAHRRISCNSDNSRKGETSIPTVKNKSEIIEQAMPEKRRTSPRRKLPEAKRKKNTHHPINTSTSTLNNSSIIPEEQVRLHSVHTDLPLPSLGSTSETTLGSTKDDFLKPLINDYTKHFKHLSRARLFFYYKMAKQIIDNVIINEKERTDVFPPITLQSHSHGYNGCSCTEPRVEQMKTTNHDSQIKLEIKTEIIETINDTRNSTTLDQSLDKVIDLTGDD